MNNIITNVYLAGFIHKYNFVAKLNLFKILQHKLKLTEIKINAPLACHDLQLTLRNNCVKFLFTKEFCTAFSTFSDIKIPTFCKVFNVGFLDFCWAATKIYSDAINWKLS